MGSNCARTIIEEFTVSDSGLCSVQCVTSICSSAITSHCLLIVTIPIFSTLLSTIIIIHSIVCFTMIGFCSMLICQCLHTVNVLSTIIITHSIVGFTMIGFCSMLPSVSALSLSTKPRCDRSRHDLRVCLC